MIIKRILLCLALLAPSALALADSPAATAPAKRDATTFSESQINEITSMAVLQRMVAGYEKLKDDQRLAWTLKRASELNPNSGDMRLALALTYARMGKKSETYDLLLKMKEQGYGIDLSDDARFDKVKGTEAWDYIVESLNMNLKLFGEGKVAFELPKGDTLFESIAWDAKRQQFLVGSVREGKIYLSDKQGKLKEFISPADGSGLWSVYAMAVDAPRDLLYVTSSSSLYFKGFREQDYNKSGVFKFKLSTGKLIDKILMPTAQGGRSLASITVSKQGKVYFADALHNEIYTIEGSLPKLVIANPKLTSVRGLALSDDGDTLYFADYALGLFGADLKSATGFAVNHDPARLVLGGIEGLFYYQGNLIAIENGMSPKRVVRLALSKDGRSIEKMMPIDIANPAFTFPTSGTLVGDELYFIADSQRGLYGQYGDLKHPDQLKAVQVFRSNARYAWNEGGIAGTSQPAQRLPATQPAAASAPAPAAEKKN